VLIVQAVFFLERGHTDRQILVNVDELTRVPIDVCCTKLSHINSRSTGQKPTKYIWDRHSLSHTHIHTIRDTTTYPSHGLATVGMGKYGIQPLRNLGLWYDHQPVSVNLSQLRPYDTIVITGASSSRGVGNVIISVCLFVHLFVHAVKGKRFKPLMWRVGSGWIQQRPPSSQPWSRVLFGLVHPACLPMSCIFNWCFLFLLVMVAL